MNCTRHGSSAMFETKSSFCRVAPQSSQCYRAVARIDFKRRAPRLAKVEFNLINLVRHGRSTTFETGLTIFLLINSTTGFNCTNDIGKGLHIANR